MIKIYEISNGNQGISTREDGVAHTGRLKIRDDKQVRAGRGLSHSGVGVDPPYWKHMAKTPRPLSASFLDCYYYEGIEIMRDVKKLVAIKN